MVKRSLSGGNSKQQPGRGLLGVGSGGGASTATIGASAAAAVIGNEQVMSAAHALLEDSGITDLEQQVMNICHQHCLLYPIVHNLDLDLSLTAVLQHMPTPKVLDDIELL
jgi:hypothetical protein